MSNLWCNSNKGRAFVVSFMVAFILVLKRLRRRQYDPAIIERTIGLVFGPFTALYRSLLERCTLTNKAVGTIWQVVSKPLQTGYWSPSPLIVSRDSFTLWTWARVQTARSKAYYNGCPYLFSIYVLLYYYMIVYYICMTSPLWLAVGPQSI